MDTRAQRSSLSVSADGIVALRGRLTRKKARAPTGGGVRPRSRGETEVADTTEERVGRVSRRSAPEEAAALVERAPRNDSATLAAAEAALLA